jgi:hypothetical protein
VYFSGIISPEPNAVLVSSIGGRGVAVGGTGVAVGDGGGPQPPTARTRKVTERSNGKVFFICLPPHSEAYWAMLSFGSEAPSQDVYPGSLAQRKPRLKYRASGMYQLR